MAQEFRLPDLGEGVQSGDVVRVLVAEGDTVKPEQPIIEIETDKAVVEVPCPFGGRIAKLHVKQGDKIPVGQVLVTVEAQGAEPTAPKTDAPSATRNAVATIPTNHPAPQPTAPQPTRPLSEARPPTTQPALSDEIVPAGPATRRLARELGVDLHSVAALRPGQRLTEDDIKAFVKQIMTSSPAHSASAAVAPPLPDFAQWGPIERVALSSLQRPFHTNRGKTVRSRTPSW